MVKLIKFLLYYTLVPSLVNLSTYDTNNIFVFKGPNGQFPPVILQSILNWRGSKLAPLRDSFTLFLLLKQNPEMLLFQLANSVEHI